MPKPDLRLATLLLLAATAACAAEGDDDDTPWTDDDNLVSDDEVASDAELDGMLSDGKADSALGYQAVAQLAHDAGIPCTGERIALATAVAKAESGFRPRITNTAGNAHGIDRGLWQINSYWHPEVSATCALSASCNARAAARISRQGRRWREWWTWKNTKNVPFMSRARAAQAAVCGG